MRCLTICLVLILMGLGCFGLDELDAPDGNPFDPESSNYGGLKYISMFSVPEFVYSWLKYFVVSDDGEFYLARNDGSIYKYDSSGELQDELVIGDEGSDAIQGVYWVDDELCVVAYDSGLMVKRYSSDLQLISEFVILDLSAEEWAGDEERHPYYVAVDNAGNYYVTYYADKYDDESIKLYVRVFDNSGNFATDFTLDTDGMGLSGNVYPIRGIAFNGNGEKYFKLVTDDYEYITVKYGADNTRVKYWEFGWSLNYFSEWDRLAVSKENFICVSTSENEELIEVYNDEESVARVSLTDAYMTCYGLAFSKTENKLYIIAYHWLGRFDESILTFQYDW